MDHKIYVTAQGLSAAALAEELEKVPGTQVQRRRTTDQLALDPVSVALIVAAFGTVNALITALGSIWAARITKSTSTSSPPTPLMNPVLHLQTDTDEVKIAVGPAGNVVSLSAPLPETLDQITEIHLSVSH